MPCSRRCAARLGLCLGRRWAAAPSPFTHTHRGAGAWRSARPDRCRSQSQNAMASPCAGLYQWMSMSMLSVRSSFFRPPVLTARSPFSEHALPTSCSPTILSFSSSQAYSPWTKSRRESRTGLTCSLVFIHRTWIASAGGTTNAQPVISRNPSGKSTN
jgi:hypothetical protein